MNRHHQQWQHSHDYFYASGENESRTNKVMLLTAVTMVAEIAAGTIFGSMALLADGWHMGTHVAAFAITLFAYRYQRKNINNPDFTFGPGKITVLGGFASAIALAVVALMMAVESIARFFAPTEIAYGQSILVACIGLAVNIISAVILHGDHSHGHSHGHDHHHHDHDHDHHHHDHNLKAAYFHVLADALTSVLAIIALIFGSWFGWWMLDPLMGIVGAGVILVWAKGLIKESSSILLDADIDGKVRVEITQILEQEDDVEISDLHVWKVGPNHLAAIVSLITHSGTSVAEFRHKLADIDHLEHLTVEVVYCREEECLQSIH